ncbi:hypothetical protein ES707_12052 [subsurface metagenome]
MRVWADVSLRYEKHIFANSTEELSKYILKDGHVSGIYEDEQIAYDLKRTVAAMLRDGIPRCQIVEETSALYGIPVECVEEVVAAGEADCDLIPGVS